MSDTPKSGQFKGSDGLWHDLPEQQTRLEIKIRDDVTIRIAGIPHDFTEEEAARVARVVMAHATVVDGPGRVLLHDSPKERTP